MQTNIETQRDGEKLELNVEAQGSRHKRVFLSLSPLRRLFAKIALLSRIRRRKMRYTSFTDKGPAIKDPFSRFLRQTATIAVALFVVTSFAPGSLLETGFTADLFPDAGDTDFVQGSGDEALELPAFLMNEEGFVLKPSPASETVSRIGLNDAVKHTIVPGDTLSTIANLYGISLKTLLWENGLHELSVLKVGQVLTIPPLDGVNHTVVAKKDTLSSIAKQYGVEEKLIREHNNLQGDVIADGQKLFIPGGTRKDPILTPARAGIRTAQRSGGSTNAFNPKVVMATSAQPEGGASFIFPTVGRITQGFKGGHWAWDIGNPSMPDIWAPFDGVVTETETVCPSRDIRVERNCGHGYGNLVKIDHGDGVVTLYGHLNAVYVVPGQQLIAGQAIGQMGNSGRAYGATGRHLHWEVYENGQRKNPGNYLQ